MKRHDTVAGPATLEGSYLALIRRLPLRPLRTDDDLARAVAVLNELLDLPELDEEQADYLDVLGDLIRNYELEHHPIPPVADADMLRYLIDAKGATQAQVAEETGVQESTISEVLAGKRGLSRANIGRLARYFHVSPAVFRFD